MEILLYVGLAGDKVLITVDPKTVSENEYIRSV
jgi:hypothetical protein